MDAIKLGKFIAKMRNEKGLKQEEVAEQLNIDSKKISRWECGNSIPDFDMLISLSKILDVTLYEFSICEKVEDKSFLETTKSKVKTIKDFKNLQKKKKVKILIIILLSILFFITALYTIMNYGKVEVYTFRSLDKDFVIKGKYIVTPKEVSFDIIDVSYSDIKNPKVKNLEYYITQGDQVIINSTNVLWEDNKNYYPLNDLIKYIHSTNHENIQIDKNQKFTLEMIYNIKGYEDVEKIKFDFELVKNYINTF